MAGPLGEMKKTLKVEPVDEVNERFCNIFDAMAVVQKARTFKTFGDLAMDLF